jgi:hypothetical protein
MHDFLGILERSYGFRYSSESFRVLMRAESHHTYNDDGLNSQASMADITPKQTAGGRRMLDPTASKTQ